MKLNNYNINLNPDKLSSRRIEQHQDFNRLLQQYKESPRPGKPGRKMRWVYFVSGAIAACLLGFVIYTQFISDPQPLITTEEYLAERPYINPPLEDVQAQFANIAVDAHQGGEYVYESGSKLIVPPAAFVDESGAAVGGNINIRYREFHDYVDFFLSGIPMEYDSAGTRYQLESAGMVEIYAEKDGQRLNIAPGKEIAVELVSEIPVLASKRGKSPHFNIYRLDVEGRNWVYKGEDQIEVIDETAPAQMDEREKKLLDQNKEILAKIESKEADALVTIEASIPRPVPPLKPERADKDAQVFSFEFNDNQLIYNRNLPDEARQQLSQAQQQLDQLRRDYGKIIWQVADYNPGFDKEAAARIAWDDMEIRPLNSRDYELTLINGSNRMKVIVRPVLTGSDYEKAMAEFNQSYQQYEQEVAKRQQRLKAQKEQLEQTIREEKALAQKQLEEQLAIYRSRGQHSAASRLMIKQKILNRFRVSDFGIWNCDRPLPPFLARVKGEFVDNRENYYIHHTAFLVNKNKNTVSRFCTAKGNDVIFDTESDNILFLVTRQNKLAVFRPEEFKRINKDKDDFTFVLDVVDKPIDSEEDVRKILEF